MGSFGKTICIRMTKINAGLFVLLTIFLIFFRYTHAKNGEEKNVSKVKRSFWLIRNRCNIWTGLRARRCSYKEKYRKDTYKACGWWWRKRCKTGTTYFWKYKWRTCHKRCPVNGGWTGWSRWGTWGGCHGSSCVGQQKRLRTRSCTHPRQRNGGRHCRGSSFEWMSRSCRPVHSKVNGSWGSWGQWRAHGACSNTCGKGRRLFIRQRTCTRPAPKCGGRRCPGPTTQNKYKSCFLKKCVVDGGWGAWQTWGDYKICSKTCGTGTKVRHRVRYCDNPSPSNGGAKCQGKDRESDDSVCNVHGCPRDGKWSAWGQWGHFRHCSETCGHGVRYRYRYRECNDPEPENGGKKCPGSLKDEEFKRCFLQKCPKMRMKLISKTDKIMSDFNSTKTETSPVITGDSVNLKNQTSI
uniref:Hemicentin-1 n=1 Tax=Magallana gigas TaxID=29159 RepID=A0A8W8JB42_MAGGI|nr:coadhesin [Crassostrea gigas]